MASGETTTVGMTRRRLRTRRRGLALRRIRAVLAGGLVLGVGATVTLASWNDGEYATATFTSGSFGIQGSLDGSTYADHNPSANPNPSPAATLSFTPAITGMYPGAVSYAPFAVRTISGSLAGRVQLQVTGAPTGGLTALRYGVKTVPNAASCTAVGYASGTAVIADGTTLDTGSTSFQNLGANSGSPVTYCFAITLPATAGNNMQGQSLTQTWQFAAVTP
jgi:predicted ribosomally synthesized peptide with SipW-like signal peptide